MSHLGTISLSGGIFQLTGLSSSADNLPATDDYIYVGTEKFVFNRSAASASVYGYVYTGTTIDECIQNLHLAINTANRKWFNRPLRETQWSKDERVYDTDMHYDGRYYLIDSMDGYPQLTGISQYSGSISGSSLVVVDLTNTRGF